MEPKVSKKSAKILLCLLTCELKMSESLQAKVMFANDTRRPCIVPLLLTNYISIIPNAQPC